MESVKIVNAEGGYTISESAQWLDTMRGRSSGLIGSPRKDIVLVFRWQLPLLSTIHMFGMGYPIDAIWVDSKLRVVDVKRDVPVSKISKPSTWFSKPAGASKYVIELAKGDVGETKIGDRIKFE